MTMADENDSNTASGVEGDAGALGHGGEDAVRGSAPPGGSTGGSSEGGGGSAHSNPTGDEPGEGEVTRWVGDRDPSGAGGGGGEVY